MANIAPEQTVISEPGELPSFEFHLGPCGRAVVQAALLLGLVWVAYLPALKAGFIWDDPDYVTDNTTLHDSAGLRKIWLEPDASPQYYPLTMTSFWAEFQLAGLNPLRYHADNILLQMANALLLWWLLYRLDIRVAWLAAALFAVHPVHVESVAWVTERKNLLSGFFYLLAMLAYLKSGFAFGCSGVVSAEDVPGFRSEDARTERRHLIFYFFSLALFICALLSKTVVCSMPAAILLLIYWKRGQVRGRDVLPLIPFFMVGLAMADVTAVLEHKHVGAVGPEFAFTIADRVLIAGRALWFYAAKLVWPAELTFIYPRWRIDPGEWWQWLYPAGAVVAIMGLAAARRWIGRGPVVAALLFAGTLLPALGFTNVYPMRYSFVADHFQYLASIALLVPIAWLLTPALRFAGDRYMRDVASFAPALLLLPLALLTYAQSGIYLNAEELWRDTVKKNPGSWMAQMNLGHAMVAQDRDAIALIHYRLALQLEPKVPETHFDVANALSAGGQFDAAVEEFNRALQIDPQFAQAYYGIGNVYRKQGKPEEAIAYYRKALEKQEHYPQAHFNLGVTLEERGKIDEAIAAYQAAVVDNPTYSRAHYSLGICLIKKERFTEALPHLQKVVSVYPGFTSARVALAGCYQRAGNLQAAANELAEAMRQDPQLMQHLSQAREHPAASHPEK